MHIFQLFINAPFFEVSSRAVHALFGLRAFVFALSHSSASFFRAHIFALFVFRAPTFGFPVSFRARASILIYNKESKARTGKARQDMQNRTGTIGLAEQDIDVF